MVSSAEDLTWVTIYLNGIAKELRSENISVSVNEGGNIKWSLRNAGAAPFFASGMTTGITGLNFSLKNIAEDARKKFSTMGIQITQVDIGDRSKSEVELDKTPTLLRSLVKRHYANEADIVDAEIALKKKR